jgi:hypothetical protein
MTRFATSRTNLSSSAVSRATAALRAEGKFALTALLAKNSGSVTSPKHRMSFVEYGASRFSSEPSFPISRFQVLAMERLSSKPHFAVVSRFARETELMKRILWAIHRNWIFNPSSFICRSTSAFPIASLTGL